MDKRQSAFIMDKTTIPQNEKIKRKKKEKISMMPQSRFVKKKSKRNKI